MRASRSSTKVIRRFFLKQNKLPKFITKDFKMKQNMVDEIIKNRYSGSLTRIMHIRERYHKYAHAARNTSDTDNKYITKQMKSLTNLNGAKKHFSKLPTAQFEIASRRVLAEKCQFLTTKSWWHNRLLFNEP